MRIVIVAASALLAAGCLGGLKEPVPQPLMYRIDAPRLTAGESLPADLKVDVGQAAPGLEGAGIATRLPGQRLEYIAGARWAQVLPQLLEAAMVEGLQDSGRLRSVQSDYGRFRATHTLVVDVRRFEADYTGGGLPVAQVALAVTLGRSGDRRILAAFTVSASESATENRQSAIVAALDAAFAKATAELAERSFAAIASDPGKAAAAADSANGAAAPRLSARDFEPLAGAPWRGKLTYKDYGSGGAVSIESLLVVSKARPDGLAWTFEYRYPREPEADSSDELAISADGRLLNGESVVERSQPAGGALQIVTERSGTDDERPALLRHTYAIAADRFSIRKEVRFEGTSEFLERYRYYWTR